MTYPFDVLKSRIQTLPDASPAIESSLQRAASRVLQEQGWRGFFRGLSPALIRAVPANAVTFLMYETSLRHMKTTFLD